MKNAHLAHIIILLDTAGLLNYKDEYFNSTEGSGSAEQEANDCRGCLQRWDIGTGPGQRGGILTDG